MFGFTLFHEVMWGMCAPWRSKDSAQKGLVHVFTSYMLTLLCIHIYIQTYIYIYILPLLYSAYIYIYIRTYIYIYMYMSRTCIHVTHMHTCHAHAPSLIRTLSHTHMVKYTYIIGRHRNSDTETHVFHCILCLCLSAFVSCTTSQHTALFVNQSHFFLAIKPTCKTDA